MIEPRDSGQIGVLVVALATVTLLVAQGLARFGDALVDAARAQSVADAVALAVAGGRHDVVGDLTRDLHATVVDVLGDDEVTVRVVVNGRVAVSRAVATGAATTP